MITKLSWRTKSVRQITCLEHTLYTLSGQNIWNTLLRSTNIVSHLDLMMANFSKIHIKFHLVEHTYICFYNDSELYCVTKLLRCSSSASAHNACQSPCASTQVIVVHKWFPSTIQILLEVLLPSYISLKSRDISCTRKAKAVSVFRYGGPDPMATTIIAQSKSLKYLIFSMNRNIENFTGASDQEKDLH